MKYNHLPNEPGIYLIKNTVNGKIYVGQSVHVRTRIVQHINAANAGKYQWRICRAMRKYGIENFEASLLEVCHVDNLNSREEYWIEKLDSARLGYNIATKAQSNLGIKKTPEQKSRLRLAMEQAYKRLKNSGGKIGRPVTVYDLQTRKITHYNSKVSASEVITLPENKIPTIGMVSKLRYFVITGKYSLDEMIEKYETYRDKTKKSRGTRRSIPVLKLDDSKNVLTRYMSAREAIKDGFGQGKISQSIKTGKKYKGFYWQKA